MGDDQRAAAIVVDFRDAHLIPDAAPWWNEAQKFHFLIPVQAEGDRGQSRAAYGKGG